MRAIKQLVLKPLARSDESQLLNFEMSRLWFELASRDSEDGKIHYDQLVDVLNQSELRQQSLGNAKSKYARSAKAQKVENAESVMHLMQL